MTEGRISKLLREYPNLCCDISAGSGANALMRDKEFAVKFIEEFSDRILYGCDICATLNTHQYVMNDFLTELYNEKLMSHENWKKIARDKAVRLLNL